IGFGQAVEGRIELGNRGTLVALERVEVGETHAQRPISGNERLHRNLLAGNREVRFRRMRYEGIGLGALGKRLDDGSVCLISSLFGTTRRRNVLKLIKLLTPLFRNGARIIQTGLVQLLYVRRITSKKIGSR